MIGFLRTSLLVLMFGYAGISSVYAQAATAKNPATERLQQALVKMSETGGFSCRFLQVVYFSEGGEQQYSGTLAIKRPGHFRWQYVTPYEQLYVSSGHVVWHYEADLMQAERMKNFDSVDPIAMKLLDGRVGVKDIKLLASESLGNGDVSYRIQIDQGPELVLVFSATDDLQWLESEDMLGNRNRMILSNVNREVPSKDLFQFVPPEGVEVIDIVGSFDEPEQNN
jgi:outer membrane lipoprotein carrier protein